MITHNEYVLLKKLVENSKIMYFYGEIGVGKTTMVSFLIKKVLGRSDAKVQSPTFSIVNHYKPDLYHCDFYRLQTFGDAEDIGITEIIDRREDVFLIEWPDLLKDHITPDLSFNMNMHKDSSRRISIMKHHSNTSVQLVLTLETIKIKSFM